MSKLFNAPDPKGVPRSAIEQFEQDKWWKGQDQWHLIKDMTPAHRDAARKLMLTNATRTAFIVGQLEQVNMWDAPDGVFTALIAEDQTRMADPQKWIKSTPLYRALAASTKADKKRAKREARERADAARAVEIRKSGQLEALRAVRAMLADWIEFEGTHANHDYGARGDSCANHYHIDDVTQMIDDAASELGLKP